MSAKKKGHSCLKLILFGLLLLLVFGGFILYIVKVWAPPRQPSAETPKAGYWSGRYAHFTLTADGKINDFRVYAADSTMTNCSWGWKDKGPTLINGKFSAGSMEAGRNGVDGYFAVDGKFHGTYSLSICGQWQVSPAKSGNWDAKWISESKPTPNY